MSSFIGPALPPHLQRKAEYSESYKSSKSNKSQREQARERDTDSCNAVIGPSLPPELTQTVNCPSPSVPEPTGKGDVQTSEFGPSLPPHLHAAFSDSVSPSECEDFSIGSSVLTSFRKGASTTENSHQSQSSHMASTVPLPKETDEDDESSVLVLDADVSDEEAYKDDPQVEMYGPALPPGLKLEPSRSTEGETARGILGPCLPPGMKLSDSADHESSDSDTDVLGPMPAPEGANSTTYLQDQLDDRALRMKRKLAGEDGSHGDGPMKRESWMLELPPDRAADFGMGPRQFRARAKPESGDRSVWTDTPADRLQKKHSTGEKSDAIDELKLRAIEKRDKEMQHLVEKHTGKKRQESLLEAHQKELKKKRKNEKEEGKCEERRPFDRNIDLQANRFDEAQKKAIFKKGSTIE